MAQVVEEKASNFLVGTKVSKIEIFFSGTQWTGLRFQVTAGREAPPFTCYDHDFDVAIMGDLVAEDV